MVKSNKTKELVKLGKLVKKARKNAKMTQRELAYSIDKDTSSITRLERGRINPSYIYLLEICKGIGISINELFEEKKV